MSNDIVKGGTGAKVKETQEADIINNDMNMIGNVGLRYEEYLDNRCRILYWYFI